MDCGACHESNPADARWCGRCGSPLGSVAPCPVCGRSNARDQAFCHGCGEALAGSETGRRDPHTYTPRHLARKILTQKAALEGERKQVTVLFVDVSGSMAIAAGVDAEEWHRILDRFFAILSEGVHRFDGTINQFTGDGVMALFGAPIAHEDHAERACFAALHLTEQVRSYASELRRSHGLNFSARMGLNSGEVVVGRIGDDLRMDYTAQGHTVGLAARMEQLAEPGRIYLAESTAAIVGGRFRLRDLGSFEVKGVDGGVRVSELEGPGVLRSRLEVARSQGFSRFVGRALELAELDQRLGAGRARTDATVGICAEAGVGKSRLCFEFAERQRERGAAVHAAHGVSHGRMRPFLPVRELFRDLLGISGNADEESLRDRVAGRLVRLSEPLTDALPAVFEFLGIPDPERRVPDIDTEQRQEQLVGVAERLLRASEAPTLVWIEDLHWLDAASEAFFAQLARALSDTAVRFLVNYRPEYDGPWRASDGFREIVLEPLGPDDVAELLDDLVGRDPSVARLREQIATRTEGNPFFVEELVRSLLESGHLEGQRGQLRQVRPVDEAAIPASVHAVLGARIDRLAEDEKAVLHVAAVIGRQFSHGVLHSVVEVDDERLEEVLLNLAASGLIRQDSLYPEPQWSFSHTLTQEVALATQLQSARGEIHERIAEALEGRAGDRIDDYAGLIAEHREAAGDATSALTWHVRAARHATGSHPGDALVHWRRVRSLAPRPPPDADTRDALLEASLGLISLAPMLGLPDKEVDEVFAHARELAEAAAPEWSVRLRLRYGNHWLNAGEIERALAWMEDASRRAALCDDTELRQEAGQLLSVAYSNAGRLREALDALGPPRPLRGPLTRAHLDAFRNRGRVLSELGRFDEAREALRHALDLARLRPDAPRFGVMAHLAWVALGHNLGDPQLVHDHATRALDATEGIGRNLLLAQAHYALAEAHLLAERFGPAVAAAERALAIARRSHTSLYIHAEMLGVLAEALAGDGQLERARATSSQAVATASQRWMSRLRARLSAARVQLASPSDLGHERVRELLDEALRVVEATGAEAWRPIVLVESARAARRAGDDARAQRELETARSAFAAAGTPDHAALRGLDAA